MKKYIGALAITGALLLGGCAESEVDTDKLRDEIREEEKAKLEEELGLTNAEETEVDETEVEDGKENEKREKPLDTAGTTEKVEVEYVRVVDGDTARFVYNGEEMPVRYLLIDTPESKHPKVGWQPYGQEASDRNQELLENADKVYLEFDIGQRQDHYNRLLAYVWADDILINELLVEEGLAIKAYIKAPNTRHLDRIEKAQEKAKANKTNVWSLDNYVMGEDFRGGSKVDGNKNYPQFINEDEVKKEKNSNQGGKVNVDQSSTNDFNNCTELREVYPDGVPSDHPAYKPKMDRNKDGWACE